MHLWVKSLLYDTSEFRGKIHNFFLSYFLLIATSSTFLSCQSDLISVLSYFAPVLDPVINSKRQGLTWNLFNIVSLCPPFSSRGNSGICLVHI